MKLYGFSQSRSFRALWALEEAGLDYEYIAINFGSEDGPHGSRSPEYMAINPQGKVPTLIDGSLTLTESGAMLNHIARKAPEKKLIPLHDEEMLARYENFLFFVLSDLEQPLWTNGKHRFALPEEQRVPQMLETATWEFAKAQRALHHQLEGRKFVVGDHFSAADILLAHTLNWADRFKFPVDKELLEYRDTHFQRPAAQKTLTIVS
ncbi:MAG: glutathione S-transferase family protein [Gammaproteobacteria bacterium]|nr:glutathione S-transferase family protein [Pseudomonadales bacterium]MCP5349117.1 glutathione S-transferase family protein [Pseudomonadales bacterium]